MSSVDGVNKNSEAVSEKSPLASRFAGRVFKSAEGSSRNIPSFGAKIAQFKEGKNS